MSAALIAPVRAGANSQRIAEYFQIAAVAPAGFAGAEGQIEWTSPFYRAPGEADYLVASSVGLFARVRMAPMAKRLRSTAS